VKGGLPLPLLFASDHPIKPKDVRSESKDLHFAVSPFIEKALRS